MADISKISPDNGTTIYNLKDIEARKRVPEVLLKDTVGWTGKNLLKIPASVVTQTINGVTFTVNRNSDGEVTSVVANGTASANTSFYFAYRTKWNFDKEIIYSGCAANGTDNTYSFQLYDSVTTQSYLDKGSGVTIPTSVKEHDIDIFIRIASGYVCNDVVFYPMLRDASISDSTYEPYHASVKQTLRDAEVIEGKNLLYIDDSVITQTINGVTFTVNRNSDGEVTSVVVNGTASADTYFMSAEPNIPFTKAGTYKATCGVIGSWNEYGMYIKDWTSNTSTMIDNADKNIALSVDSKLSAVIIVKSGKTLNNVTFYPMLRDASEPDNTFEPYYIPLKDSKFDRAEQAVLGVKNLFDAINIPENPKTISGATYSINNDEFIIATDAQINSGMYYQQSKLRKWFADKVGIVGILSFEIKADSQCMVKAGPESNFILMNVGTSYQKVNATINDLSQISAIIFYSQDTTSTHTLYVKDIMIRLASDPDDTYVPYAMTNRELTEKAQGIIDAANNAADFAAFKTAIASL